MDEKRRGVSECMGGEKVLLKAGERGLGWREC